MFAVPIQSLQVENRSSAKFDKKPKEPNQAMLHRAFNC